MCVVFSLYTARTAQRVAARAHVAALDAHDVVATLTARIDVDRLVARRLLEHQRDSVGDDSGAGRLSPREVEALLVRLATPAPVVATSRATDADIVDDNNDAPTNKKQRERQLEFEVAAALLGARVAVNRARQLGLGAALARDDATRAAANLVRHANALVDDENGASSLYALGATLAALAAAMGAWRRFGDAAHR